MKASKPASPSASTALKWDEKHLKALLGMRRHSARILLEEPWKTWIEDHGGLAHIRNHLRTGTLSPNQRDLLELILAHPNASPIFYASRLHLTSSPYFVRLKELTQVLLSQLNHWKYEPAFSVRPTSNLPAALTQLVGAQQALAAIVATLRRPGVRLLTLTGPGGVGKTRLAIAAGNELLDDFRDGVFLAPLETLNDPDLLPTQIARAMNLEAVGGQSLFDSLKSYLHERQILLILDNFEQLVQGSQLVSELLQAASNLKVLVTSREALNLYGENRFTVPELVHPDPSHPPSIDQIGQWPAVELFVQRVQARYPKFVANETNLEAIVHICHHLDGLPLAIELAAAQVKLLSPAQPLPQIDHRLRSLRDNLRDRPSRQKTLWDAIDWSYQLLSTGEQALFRRLAVFGREWSLEAAEAVCGVENLSASLEGLADKSLLQYIGKDEEGDPRFQMLQPVREYALDQLANNRETEQARRSHAGYFLGMAEQAEPAIGRPDELRWIHRIKQERENLQIALQWMLDQEETEMAFRLLGAVWRYYNMLNIWDETKSWMDRALAQGAHLKSAAHVKTLWGATWLTTHYNDLAGAMLLAEQGLALAREIGDRRLTGLLLQNVADGFRNREEYDKSLRLLEESLTLFRQMDDKEEVGWVLAHIASVVLARGERARGVEVLKESLSIFRATGYQWGVAAILWQLGTLAAEDGNTTLAIEAATERLAIFRAIGGRQLISQSLYELAALLWQQGSSKPVKSMVEESLALAQEIGDQAGIAQALNFQGRMALEEANPAEARGLFEKARRIFQAIGDQAALADNLKYLSQLDFPEDGTIKN